MRTTALLLATLGAVYVAPAVVLTMLGQRWGGKPADLAAYVLLATWAVHFALRRVFRDRLPRV